MANLDKIKATLKEKKGAVILVVAAVAILVVVMTMSSGDKSGTGPSAKKPVQLGSPTKEVTGMALAKSSKQQAAASATAPVIPGAAPTTSTDPLTAPPTSLLQNPAGQPGTPSAAGTPAPLPPPAPMPAPTLQVETRQTSSTERVRGFYDTSASTNSQGMHTTVAGVVNAAPATESSTPAPVATPPAQITKTSRKTKRVASLAAPVPRLKEMIVPGMQFNVTFMTGAIVTTTGSKIVGVVGEMVGPRLISRDYSGCIAIGMAKLNLENTRIDAGITTISCPTKQIQLQSFARDNDYLIGITGRYYSHATERILLSAVPAFGAEYMNRKMQALQESQTVTSGLSAVTTTNVQDPNAYAMAAGWSAGFKSVQDELGAVRNRTVPANVLDPGKTVTFFIEGLTEAKSIYDNR